MYNLHFKSSYSYLSLYSCAFFLFVVFFFFNDTATTEIYTLSLHDALPILTCHICSRSLVSSRKEEMTFRWAIAQRKDRKSTRLNSSHANISYAVFCLKKKKKKKSKI